MFYLPGIKNENIPWDTNTASTYVLDDLPIRVLLISTLTDQRKDRNEREKRFNEFEISRDDTKIKSRKIQTIDLLLEVIPENRKRNSYKGKKDKIIRVIIMIIKKKS